MKFGNIAVKDLEEISRFDRAFRKDQNINRFRFSYCGDSISERPFICIPEQKRDHRLGGVTMLRRSFSHPRNVGT